MAGISRNQMQNKNSHGNGGNLAARDEIYDLLLRTGNSVFTYDYQGYGRSEGKASIRNLVPDAKSAYAYLRNDLKIPPDRIILFGESLGTSITGQLSKTAACAGVVLQCPIYSLARRGREIIDLLKIYPEWTWPEGSFDNATVFSGKHAPLLIISGTKDKQTPVSHADALVAACADPKPIYVRIEGAGHTGSKELMEAKSYYQGLQEFLKRLDAR